MRERAATTGIAGTGRKEGIVEGETIYYAVLRFVRLDINQRAFGFYVSGCVVGKIYTLHLVPPPMHKQE